MPLSGATRAEIESHYDRGDAFYGLWLGARRIYSCALWDGDADTLDAAQARKHRFHLGNLELAPDSTLLDVGCGWGSLLHDARRDCGARHAVGLTLSENQCRSIADAGDTGIDARLESWSAHEPARPYDGIVSIGAFEHFARPEQSPTERMAIYRAFFAKCHAWLRPGARLSLQTIAYGSLAPEQASPFMRNVIFPGSELPKPGEIASAALDHFELLSTRDDAAHYARTCEAWLRNLQRNRRAARELVGAGTVSTYEHYLRLSAIGFHTRRIVLLRLLFRRRDSLR
jgi:cyclopropane-fatty-acyl-phospholipid synthase